MELDDFHKSLVLAILVAILLMLISINGNVNELIEVWK